MIVYAEQGTLRICTMRTRPEHGSMWLHQSAPPPYQLQFQCQPYLTRTQQKAGSQSLWGHIRTGSDLWYHYKALIGVCVEHTLQSHSWLEVRYCSTTGKPVGVYMVGIFICSLGWMVTCIYAGPPLPALGATSWHSCAAYHCKHTPTNCAVTDGVHKWADMHSSLH